MREAGAEDSIRQNDALLREARREGEEQPRPRGALKLLGDEDEVCHRVVERAQTKKRSAKAKAASPE